MKRTDIVGKFCLPKRHLGVLQNSFKSVRAFQIELKFGGVGFEDRRKPECRRKTSRSKEENQPTNSTHILGFIRNKRLKVDFH